jgi:hypothetical protein
MNSKQIEAHQKQLLDLSNDATVRPDLQVNLTQSIVILEVALQLALFREKDSQ